MLEVKSGTSGSVGSPLADILITSGPSEPVVVVLLLAVFAKKDWPPPAFALFGAVLLIKGLSAAAPICKQVGSRREEQVPTGCGISWSASGVAGAAPHGLEVGRSRS